MQQKNVQTSFRIHKVDWNNMSESKIWDVLFQKSYFKCGFIF